MAILKRNKSMPLRAGRPPLSSASGGRSESNLPLKNTVNARRKSSKATRKLINTHHQLHKARAAALDSKDHHLVARIDNQIEQLGGLEAYQQASLTGQDKDRGGDSSEKLVEWLRKYDLLGPAKRRDALRVLEVGALSSRNAISGVLSRGVGEIRRVDLHSQEPELIEEIDFMDFPVPEIEAEKYDIISLSLVLNYVPDAAGRGEMLRRTTKFLRSIQQEIESVKDNSNETRHPALPCLFLVLPLPCLNNSRYTTHNHLTTIMQHLGYEEIEHHNSTKLSYMLFKWYGDDMTKNDTPIAFKKSEINPGKTRNNFSIVLEAG
ncbi:25S rRNA (adenine2142-N1)-methyltransferase [Neophaeococcomyces mojaviensis]|uniref:25S rRNA (Adenine2142-N1)-methyltransferase n=1 Tax=Neophaeococcomyces mojaviensis TaxID=3383035 RepID=A0ACC3AC10_9EURO|nr:25S rRNA (adenine2142-N1)-methyltransferase [Knufia sp. JES_112]